MEHHLLNGVKCVREVRGLTNALIILPFLFMEAGRKRRWRGNDRPRTDIINYHRGLQDDKVSSHFCTPAARCPFMCPNHLWEFGQKIRDAFSSAQSFPDKKGETCPFFSKET